MTHLRVVLQTLKDHQLFTKFSKSEFFLKAIDFLGNIVSSERIRVKQWPKLTSSAHIRSFLGLTGYYRRFVKACSSITSAIYKVNLEKGGQTSGRRASQNLKLA